MRVLVLSQFYDPEPVFKVHPLAKDLVERGHQVTAITGFPNYPLGKIYPGYRMKWRQWEEHDGVRVLRLPIYPDHSRSTKRRALNHLSFALSASLLGPALCGPVDVIWVYDLPLTCGVSAAWLGLLRRAPYVFEVQDLWPDTMASSGMLGDSKTVRTLNRAINLVYQRAAAVTVISPGFKRNLIAKGVPAEKIHVLPNWANEEIYRPVARDEQLGNEHGLAGRFNVMYAGNMGPAQALHVVLEAATLLQDQPEIQFVLLGGGVSLPELRAEAERRQLGNVRFIERQPVEAMPHFFAWADALLVQLAADPLFSITIPSKTATYIACGRPVLCAVPGDGADLIRQAGAGLTCPPGDPAALAQTARTLYEMAPDEREAMGQAGRAAFLQQFTRRVLVDQYDALFRAL